MSSWDILGLAILVGPLALVFFSLIAWFLHAAYEDFIVKPRQTAQHAYSKARKLKILTIEPSTTTVVHEAGPSDIVATPQPVPQTEKPLEPEEDVKLYNDFRSCGILHNHFNDVRCMFISTCRQGIVVRRYL